MNILIINLKMIIVCQACVYYMNNGTINPWPKWDSNPHLSDFKSLVSAIGLLGQILL